MLSGSVPIIGTPSRFSGSASVSGVCPPNCTITPSGFSVSHDVQHVFERQRLEVQPVAGVVIGRTVSGLQFTMIDSTPSACSANEAWQQQ